MFVSDVVEKWMGQCIFGGNPVVWIKLEHLLKQVDSDWIRFFKHSGQFIFVFVLYSYINVFQGSLFGNEGPVVIVWRAHSPTNKLYHILTTHF